MKIRKLLIFVLSAVLSFGCISMLGACNGNSPKGDVNYTVYISKSDDGGYYGATADYNSNPVFNYLRENMTFNGKHVGLQFTAAPSGGDAREDLDLKLSTNDLSDVMDLAMSTSTVKQLYEDGVAMDITDYVNEYMPNYLAFLEEFPEVKKTAITYYDVDGDGELEKRYFNISGSVDAIGEPWMGYTYRRDWILKYGKNPNTNATFTGGYDADGNWSDNIIFPSWYKTELKNSYLKYDPAWDGTTPVFISDWEWMMGIFDTALNDLKLKTQKGYAAGLFYYGYIPTGELVSSFGGKENGALTYDKNGNIYFSGTSNNFKTYVDAISQWYGKGWIDPLFYANTKFYWESDTSGYIAGRVGLWLGMTAYLGSTLRDTSNPAKANYYAAGCRLPINDVYGDSTPETAGRYGAKYVPNVNEFVPESLLQSGVQGSEWIITTAAKDKDMKTLFTMIDAAFKDGWGGGDYASPDDEGIADMLSHGLSDAQIAEISDKSWGGIYTKNRLTSMGKWNSGKIEKDEIFDYDPDLKGALIGQRFPMKNTYSKIAIVGPDYYQAAMREWNFYENTCASKVDFLKGYMTSEQSKSYSNFYSSGDKYMKENLPVIIRSGSLTSSKWATFKGDLEIYGVAKQTNVFNQMISTYKTLSQT